MEQDWMLQTPEPLQTQHKLWNAEKCDHNSTNAAGDFIIPRLYIES